MGNVDREAAGDATLHSIEGYAGQWPGTTPELLLSIELLGHAIISAYKDRTYVGILFCTYRHRAVCIRYDRCRYLWHRNTQCAVIGLVGLACIVVALILKNAVNSGIIDIRQRKEGTIGSI